MHYAERGDGLPVLLLHGAGVDHREPLGTMERAFAAVDGYRRIYPDLPGQGKTPAPESIRSADDVLDALLGLVDRLVGDGPLLVVGHSAGGYFARAIAHRRPTQVIGLALICPLLERLRDIPAHAPVVQEELDAGAREAVRGYFVVQTPDTLASYTEHVAPGVEAADQPALARIGENWGLTAEPELPYASPVLVVVGRQDASVGYAGQWDLMDVYPRGTFAMLDRAGHALPHEQPELLGALVREWLRRVEECAPTRP